MSLPLEGVLVVALEQAVAAPLATCRLADAGARVIKVERPEGDFARQYDVAANGESSYFAWVNRGKESIALDLRSDDGVDVMNRLIAHADVFVQNLAAGAAERLGFGASMLRDADPSLIVCDISGYGEDGPYAHMKAYDLLVQAESGLLSVSGPAGPYGRVGVSVVDIGAGLNASLAIVEALLRRGRTGEGAHLRLSLFDTIAEWMTVPLLHHDYLGAAPERIGLAHPSIAPYGGFPTADGATLLIAVQSEREWRNLCALVLDDPNLADDPRYSSNDRRVERRHEVDSVIADAFAGIDREPLEARLRDARIAYGNINDVARLSAHPQLRRATVPVRRGTVALPAPPVRADWERIGAVPSLDEHGAAIRQELSSGRP